MSDPLDKATAKAPPTLGEGCVRRYDPEALSEEDGTDFACQWPLILTHFWPIKLTHLGTANRQFSASVDSFRLPA